MSNLLLNTVVKTGNVFKSLELKNTGPFKQQKFSFTPGLHVVYGLNKANRKSTNGNAAGKSYFFHQIPEILKDVPIVGEKSDRVKKGERTLTFEIKGREVAITRKNTKLQVSVDGKPKKFRTQGICKDWIDKHIDLSLDDISTYVHIDARIPHPLVMGKTKERRAFLSSFFTLDKLDHERKLYMAELSKLSKLKAVYSEVRNEYALAKEDYLPKDGYVKLKEQDEELTDELRQLTKRNDKLQEISTILAFYDAAKTQIKQLVEWVEVVTPESFQKRYDDTKWNLANNSKDLEDAIEWEDYQKENKVYESKYAKLSVKTRVLLDQHGLEKLQNKARKAVQRVDEIDASLKMLNETIDATDVKKPEKLAKPEYDRGEIISKLESARHQFDHVKKFKKGVCDSCGQPVKVKDPEELRKRISKLNRIVSLLDEYRDYKNDLLEYKQSKEVVSKAYAAIEELEEEVKSLRKYEKIYDELRDMPDKPPKFKGKRVEVKVKQRMVDEDKEQLQLLKFLKPNIEIIVDYFNLSRKDIKKAQNAGNLQVKIEEINEKLAKVRSKLEVQKSVRQRMKRLKSRLLEMKETLKDEEPLKLLCNAYSDKGVKKLAIQSVSNRLMEIVNRYSKMVFQEDFQFEVEWTKADLNILVHRKYGKRVETSDVRKLSGAESKLFTLILILALITFVPKRKRSNILILDEPDANMSQETTDSFKNLLTILNKLIPCIIVITPRTEQRYVDAKEYTVVKEKGQSKIAKGHPEEYARKMKAQAMNMLVSAKSKRKDRNNAYQI